MPWCYLVKSLIYFPLKKNVRPVVEPHSHSSAINSDRTETHIVPPTQHPLLPPPVNPTSVYHQPPRPTHPAVGELTRYINGILPKCLSEKCPIISPQFALPTTLIIVIKTQLRIFYVFLPFMPSVFNVQIFYNSRYTLPMHLCLVRSFSIGNYSK